MTSSRADPASSRGDRLIGAAAAVAALSMLSSAFGLLRDLSLAGLFGASSDTDAFLVAWTIPETATPLLMEGAMTFLLVPVLVAELTRVGSVTRIVRLTLLPLVVLLALLTAAAALASPLLVDLIAPGVRDRVLAIRCFRVACLTLLLMGISGYLMATLRAHGSFVRPAATFVAFNVGILVTIYALHGPLGIFAAALGLVVGSALMVAIQVPQFLRLTSIRGMRLFVSRRVVLAAFTFVPVALYTLGRQGQVFVERVVGSLIGPGAISYMNYASKVAQVPMLLAITAATVAFPSMARAAGSADVLGSKAEHELRQVVLLILPAIAFLMFFAAPSVGLLFERGAFSAGDTAATADVMRLYSLGLLGQVLTAVGVLLHFSRPGRTWLPALAGVTALLVTILVDVSLMNLLGVGALAVGNAAGITAAAAVLLGTLGWVAPWRPREFVRLLMLATPLAVAAAFCAWLGCHLLPTAYAVQAIAGSVLTLLVFLALTAAAGVPESRQLARTTAALVRRSMRQRQKEKR